MGEVKKRIFYLDELRVVAIFAVILCHVANLYPYALGSIDTLIPYFLSDIGHIGVPIFVMLSGALLLNRDYELGAFFKRRFSRILIPFIFWIVVSCILMFFVFGFNANDIFHWVVGDPGLPWYIWELLGLYLCIPIINAFINRYGMNGVKYFLALWIFALILKTLNITFLYHFNLNYFIGYMGYMVLGYYIVNMELNIDDRVMVLLGFVLFIVFTIVNCSISASMGKTTDYISIPTILQSLGVFIMIKRFALHGENDHDSSIGKIHNFIKDGTLGKMIFSISVCSYGMYFVHYLICLVWGTFDIQSLSFIPILWIVTILFSWIIVWICSNIPVLDNFSGVK